jgi:hypothetical protein
VEKIGYKERNFGIFPIAKRLKAILGILVAKAAA